MDLCREAFVLLQVSVQVSVHTGNLKVSLRITGKFTGNLKVSLNFTGKFTGNLKVNLHFTGKFNGN